MKIIFNKICKINILAVSCVIVATYCFIHNEKLDAIYFLLLSMFLRVDDIRRKIENHLEGMEASGNG